MPEELCGCPEPHGYQAWLEATLALGRLEFQRKEQYNWRERRELMAKLMHELDPKNPGKIDS
jgi:hypothetical protein